jgi:hypothetical protein
LQVEAVEPLTLAVLAEQVAQAVAEQVVMAELAQQAVMEQQTQDQVVIRYPDTYLAATSTTGSPSTVTSGGYRYYKFTGDGTITF